MSSFKQRLLKIAGKDDFELDPDISSGYLLRICRKYGWMMVRGRLLIRGKGQIAKDVFIGKKVKLLEKDKISIGEKTKIHDHVKIDALSREGVRIGHHAVIGEGTSIECTGSLEYVGKGVKIGNNTTFGAGCFFGAAGGIEIGDDVVAGQYVRFHSENHNYEDPDVLIREQGVTHKGIKIGNNCWIGAGAVFLDGAELGDGCVVGANAVVTKKFENDSVIGGIPARVIRSRSQVRK